MKSYGPVLSMYNWRMMYSRPNPPLGRRSLRIGKSAMGPSMMLVVVVAAFAVLVVVD